MLSDKFQKWANDFFEWLESSKKYFKIKNEDLKNEK